MTDVAMTPAALAREITVLVEPQGREVRFDRLNTVLQLLNKLGLRPTDALVIRDGGLLTPDVRVAPGDCITVRCVTSTG